MKFRHYHVPGSLRRTMLEIPEEDGHQKISLKGAGEVG
jgi:hypothetical protein